MWVSQLNFKFLLILFFVVSCGVKGDPVSPKGQTTPSVLDNYPDIEVDESLRDANIKKK